MKRDIQLSDYEGHALLNVNDIARLYIYYSDDHVVKIMNKNTSCNDIMSFTMHKNEQAHKLYKEIVSAIQRAKKNNNDEFIIIYGSNACLLSEANFI